MKLTALLELAALTARLLESTERPPSATDVYSAVRRSFPRQDLLHWYEGETAQRPLTIDYFARLFALFYLIRGSHQMQKVVWTTPLNVSFFQLLQDRDIGALGDLRIEAVPDDESGWLHFPENMLAPFTSTCILVGRDGSGGVSGFSPGTLQLPIGASALLLSPEAVQPLPVTHGDSWTQEVRIGQETIHCLLLEGSW